MKLMLAMLFCSAIVTTANAETITAHTGASASGVSPRYAVQFQAFVNDLEAHGANIKFMGGYRAGVCGQANKHSCGMAIDVCQYSRGVVDSRCNLPAPQEMSVIAQAHGLFSGGDWCNSDYGHIEAGGSVACGHSWGRVATGSRGAKFLKTSVTSGDESGINDAANRAEIR